MYLSISEVKQHLNIDQEFTTDDNYIESLILVAKEAVEHSINQNIDDLIVGGNLPPAIKHSMLLLIGNWYLNREPVAYSSVSKIPYTLELLVSIHKNYN
ncbi:head-tail connector protein [Proteiniphilum acetatigenes]|uniref:head-tail connector protein n=1 Tax=Proteiniphilum acetatigenes TaxID=294710 RepID=UPI0003813187|nr:head-tail connector protein [Proteiniphilum acetatigenes]